MPVHLFDRSALVATPWKNGGGVTREIACRFPGADDQDGGPFDWRISIALIASDGPFSAFEGIDRVITLLEGGGVHLQSPDGSIDHRLAQPLVPFEFPGEAPIQATLLAGDCHDFNVMTRRDRCRAKVMILREGGRVPASPDGLLMAIDGEWRVGSSRDDTQLLRPHTGLWWQDQCEPWQVERLPGLAGAAPLDAAMLLVSIEYLARGLREHEQDVIVVGRPTVP